MRKGAIAPWAKSSSPYYLQTLEALAQALQILLNEPWEDLPKKAREIILYGSGEDEIKFIYDDGLRRYETKKPFEGVIPNMQRRFKETDCAWMREELERFQDTSAVRGLQGLSPEAGSAGGEDRRAAYRPGLRAVDRDWPTLVPRPRQEADQAAAARSPRAS